MSKMTDFDPFEALMDLNERMNRLEHAHNNLACAYERTEKELDQTMEALLSLQKSHLYLSDFVSNMANNKIKRYDDTDQRTT